MAIGIQAKLHITIRIILTPETWPATIDGISVGISLLFDISAIK
jgi:hypothetical protein